MKLHSKAFNREIEVELCPKNEGELFDVVAHKSLQDIHDIEMRGQFETTLTVVKDNVNHALVKCQIKEISTGFVVEEIGEKIKIDNDTEIGRNFPVTTAATRAFDRAMIRMLGFEGKFYSDTEMSDQNNVSPAETAVTENIIPDLFTEDPIDIPDEATNSSEISDNADDYVDIPEIDDSIENDSTETETTVIEDEFGTVVNEETETETEVSSEIVDVPEEANPNDPGEFVINTGNRKGEKLSRIHAEENGKGWMDYCLGSQYVKPDQREAIAKFYASRDLQVDENGQKHIEAAKAYLKETLERLGLNG